MGSARIAAHANSVDKAVLVQFHQHRGQAIRHDCQSFAAIGGCHKRSDFRSPGTGDFFTRDGGWNRRLAEHANIHQYGLMPSLLDDPLKEGGVLTFRVQRTYNRNALACLHIWPVWITCHGHSRQCALSA